MLVWMRLHEQLNLITVVPFLTQRDFRWRCGYYSKWNTLPFFVSLFVLSSAWTARWSSPWQHCSAYCVISLHLSVRADVLNATYRSCRISHWRNQITIQRSGSLSPICSIWAGLFSDKCVHTCRKPLIIIRVEQEASWWRSWVCVNLYFSACDWQSWTSRWKCLSPSLSFLSPTPWHSHCLQYRR